MTIKERQEAAKWFQNRASHTSMPGAKMMFKRAAEALSEGIRWIPCSERLPEKNGKYLITGRQGAVNVLLFEDGRWYGRWGVVAWRELPKPYGGESE